jgi:hypothetical protein
MRKQIAKKSSGRKTSVKQRQKLLNRGKAEFAAEQINPRNTKSVTKSQNFRSIATNDSSEMRISNQSEVIDSTQPEKISVTSKAKAFAAKLKNFTKTKAKKKASSNERLQTSIRNFFGPSKRKTDSQNEESESNSKRTRSDSLEEIIILEDKSTPLDAEKTEVKVQLPIYKMESQSQPMSPELEISNDQSTEPVTKSQNCDYGVEPNQCLYCKKISRCNVFFKEFKEEIATGIVTKEYIQCLCLNEDISNIEISRELNNRITQKLQFRQMLQLK